MKNAVITLIVLSCLNINLFAQPEWKWISPNPPNMHVYSSTVVNNKAFLWGENKAVCKIDFENEDIKMLPSYTSDNNCEPGDFISQGIAFADSLNGYITDGCTGEFRTTDGGLNWTKTANAGSNIELVCFGSSQVGWKLGIGGYSKTTDAGATWFDLGGPFWSGTGLLSKINALNENKLWVLKSSYHDGTGFNFWYSSDGGLNWTEVNTGLQSTIDNQVYLYDMKINENGIGFAAGAIIHPDNNTQEGLILKTTDMGNSWTIDYFPDENFQYVLNISDNDWIILGNVGDFTGINSSIVQRRTTNCGLNWEFSYPINSHTGWSYLNSTLLSPNSKDVYLFFVGGIYKSIDKGKNYERVTSDTDVIANKIVFDSRPVGANKQMGLAWLEFNTRPYLLTTDGGLTWHKKTLPESMGFSWRAGIGENVIYMITNGTDLYKSADYGESWQRLYLNEYSALQALSVFSKDEFVLYAWHNLVSSTDGGSNWIIGPSSENLYMQETSISKSGFIAGIGIYHDSISSRSCIYRTSDYGLSWHIFDTDDELKEVDFIDDHNGYALGNKKLYKTTNGGITWTICLTSGYSWGLSTFAFFDSLNGMLDTGEGLKSTTDGGKTWVNKDYRIPFSGFDKMKYNANGDLFMIAGASIIMLPSNQNNSPSIKNNNNHIVTKYDLNQNYPNPFNPSTVISYQLPNVGKVTLKVYDVLGNEVVTLIDEYRNAGIYEVEFNGSNLASGVYFYRIQAGTFFDTKKMILLK